MNTSADSKSGIRNYDEALAQIREAGISVDHLEFGKITRYHVGEERECRGWTRLSLAPSRSGQGGFVVGRFGVFQGADPCTQKIRITSGDPNYDFSGKDYTILDLYKLASPFALHTYKTSGEISFTVSWPEAE